MPALTLPRVVRDLATGHIIASDLEYATNPWTRFRGLMLRSTPAPGGGLLIRPCSSIHMFFMRFPIDAVFFDRAGVVTGVSRNVRPWWGLAFGGRGAHAVIEMRVGDADGIEVGHELEFS